MNGPGGPWAFWIEVKGHRTPVKWPKEMKARGRAPHQARWAWRTMAAGVPVFLVRSSAHALDVLEAVGFPHQITRGVGVDQTLPDGENEVEMFFIGRGMVRALRKEENEREVQEGLKAVFGAHGFRITDTSQGYRGKRGSTRITLGMPDLYVTHPATEGGGLWIPSEEDEWTSHEE